MMRVSLLAAMAAVLAIAPAAYAQAETMHSVEKIAIDLEPVNECTGEAIHVEGTQIVILQTTIDASGGGHFHVTLAFQDVSGTTAAGERVRFVSTQVTQVGELPSHGEFTTLNNQSALLVVQGADNNSFLNFTIHFTVTPTGELRGVVDQATIGCFSNG
jgi:hypothetical protein